MNVLGVPSRGRRILAATLLLVLGVFILFSLAQYYTSATAEKRAAARYHDLIANHRITDLDALVEELAYYQFGGLPPLPGTNFWDHHAGPFPVDWANFPEALTTNLIGYWEGGVPVYDLYVFQDQDTREIVFLNSDQEEIYSIDCPYGDCCDPATYALCRYPDLYFGKYTREEIEYLIAHCDPARLGVWFKLIPTEDLHDYLLAQAQSESLFQALTAESSGGGGMAMMMSGSGGSGPLNDLDGDGIPNRDEILAGTDPEDASDFLRITNLQIVASGREVSWPSVTNRQYSVMTTTGGVALLGPQVWTVATQWLDGTGSGLVFTDEVSDAEVAFHHVQVRETDSDSDGLADWFELNYFGSLTNTTGDADVDEDGLDNAEEMFLGRDPTRDDREVYCSAFYVVVVNTNDPAGDDDGTECFDFHGSCRPLAMASNAIDAGYVAFTDDGASGGIFLNNDQDNLYVGIKGSHVGNNNAVYMFIDTGAGGVTNLRHLSTNSQPYGFSRFTNINFHATEFTPSVGLLLGSSYGDGRNFHDFDIGGNNFGQGVYDLLDNSDFGSFTTSEGNPISQWGTNDGANAHAGIEVALSLEDLGIDPGDTFKVMVLVAGGDDGSNPNRFIASEAYGNSMVGSGFEATTIIGAEVQLADVEQTLPPSAYPGFTDDDVMLQAFYWNVPAVEGVDPHWYNVLTGQVAQVATSGFTIIWLPPAYKGANPGFSVGYDPYDHYDLGGYDQGGGSLSEIRTRYGLSNELANLVEAIDTAGMVPMEDIVLNHMAGGGSTGLVYDYPHGIFEKSTNDFHPSAEGHNDTLAPYHNNEGFGTYTNFGIYGVDVAFLAPNMRRGLKQWGRWLADSIGFRAWRFDFTEGVEPWFVWEWLEHPGQRGKFAVMEYWEDADGKQMQEWLHLTGRNAAIYDWNLRDHFLKPMCENAGAFDMQELAAPSLLGLEPTHTVVFVDNHDTFRFGDTSKLGVRTNKPPAYAYAFHSPGLPLVFYHDYYEQPYLDSTATNLLGSPLSNEVDRLIRIRQVAVAGSCEVLHSDTNLYVQLRSGSAADAASVLVLNDQPGGVLSQSIQTPWTNTAIIDLVSGDAGTEVTTSTNGMATLGAPGQGYRIYAPTGVLAQVEQ